MRLRRTGTEPVTARSAYGLRTVLAAAALVAGAIGVVAFGIAASRPGGSTQGETVVAGLCAAVAVIAAVDLLILRVRTRARRGSSVRPPTDRGARE